MGTPTKKEKNKVKREQREFYVKTGVLLFSVGALVGGKTLILYGLPNGANSANKNLLIPGGILVGLSILGFLCLGKTTFCNKKESDSKNAQPVLGSFNQQPQ